MNGANCRMMVGTHFVEYEISTDEEETNRHYSGEDWRDEPRQYYKHQHQPSQSPSSRHL